jgi:hypothetical protein
VRECRRVSGGSGAVKNLAARHPTASSEGPFAGYTGAAWRAQAAQEVATVRLRAAEQAFRIAYQVLQRLRLLGRRYDTN